MVSFVLADPGLVAAAAGQLDGIRSALNQAATTASGPTTGIAAAAEDEISVAVSRVFGTFGQEFQTLNTQASAFHVEFVRLLNGGAAQYVAAELANAGAAGAALPAATDPLGGLLGGLLGGGGSGTTGGTTGGGLGGLLGGSGGILDPILFGGSGGLLGPLVGGGGVLSSVVTGAGLAPFLSSAGTQLGGLISGFAGGTGGPALTNALSGIGPTLATLPIVGDIGRSIGLLPAVVAPTTQQPYVIGSAWEKLFYNTNHNLSSLGYEMGQDPFPLLRQIGSNQQGYAVQIGHEFSYALSNPGPWADATIKGIASANPLLTLQTVVNDQVKYGNILSTSLGGFSRDVQAGFGQFQTNLQLANHDIATGNYNAAVKDGTAAFLNLFITGFDTSNLNDIKLQGPVADVLPLFALPGQEAETFANLFPAGSVPSKMTHNFANLLNAFADTSVSTTIGFETNPAPKLLLNANFGLPLQALFSVMGAPVSTLGGFATATTVIGSGLATGNVSTVVGGLFDAPAYLLDGALNGTTIVDLTMGVNLTNQIPVLGPILTALGLGNLSLPIEMHLPFSGLLTPAQPVTATVPLNIAGLLNIPINLTLGGTPFAGLAPTLLVYTSRGLADAISPAA